MNVKFVWQSFVAEMRLFVLALLLVVAAGMTGVSALIWLAIAFLIVVPVSYLESFRVRIGPVRSYHQAIKLVRKGMLNDAEAVASQYNERRPQDPQGWEARALAVFGLSRPEQALSFVDRAVASKRRWQGLMVRGLILSYLACPEAALQDLEASYKIRAHPYTRMLMGKVFASLRRMDTAIDILKRSTASVRLSDAFLSVGQCYRLVGAHEWAREAYEKAAAKARRELASGMPCGSILAYSLAQLSRVAEAEETANAALEKHRRDTLALSTQALLSLRRGEPDAVEETVRRMLLISPRPAVSALCDPQFTPLLGEKRFRELLAWALGAQRQMRERVLSRQSLGVATSG